MNAQELFIKKEAGENSFGYNPAQIWFCEKCRIVYQNKNLAEKCCQPNICGCGKVCERKYYLICDECDQKKRKKEEKEKFDKSEKIDIKDYTGYLLDDECVHDDYGAWFENYFENHDFDCPKCGGETGRKDCETDRSLSYLECKECGWKSPEYEIVDEIDYLFAPEYIWGTKFRPLELDLSEILEHATEEHHESVHDYMKGTKELQIAIDNFNKDNESCGTYFESNKLALINIKEYVKERFKR